MSSRFPPSSGFSSRGDRSPQRYADRRPVSPPPSGVGRDDPNTAPLGREPPRGPKALIDSSRGGYSGGGGGGGGRGRGGSYAPSRGGEFRDRDRDRDRDRPGGRDFRDGPPFRRDDRDRDRDWVRRDRIDRDFDARDGRPAFRRSRSPPPPRDGRDFRDSRDTGSDIVRMRRNSRDSLVSTSSNPNDGPPVGIGPPPHRGGPGRGRGRGDWDGGGGGRGRGRGHFVDDREPFRRRSRSRDGWWDRDRDRDRDRDFRDRDRDHPRDVRDRDFDRRTDRFDRRDDDRRVERDDRDRPTDGWKKDGPPVSRPDVRIPSGPRSSSIPPSASSSTSRGEPPKSLDQPGPDQFRKIPTAPARDFRRDSDRSDIAPSRTEALREPVLPKGSPPPSAPQVPAFGFVTVPPSIVSTDKPPQPSSAPQSTQPTAPKSDRPPSSSAASVNASKEVPKEAPTEPKALRNENNAQHPEPRPRRESISESWRQDLPPRAAASKAPPTGPAASPHKSVAELSPPTAPAALLKRESGLESRPPNDPFTSSSPPQGPASTSPILGRAQLSPAGRGGSPQTSPRMTFSSVPTGPRAGVRPSGPWPSARGGHAKSKQWVRPGYPRGPPSASGGPGPRRDYEDRDPSEHPSPAGGEKRGDIDHRDLEDSSEKAVSEKLENANADETMSLDAIPHATSTKDEDVRKLEKPQEEKEDVIERKETKIAEKEEGLIPDFTRSSDEEDENEVFTEDYVQERKALFEKSIRALEAELPPPTLQDPVIVDLLMKVQLLGMIADGSAPEEPGPSPVETKVEQSKKVLPTEAYKTEMETDKKEDVAVPAVEVAAATPEAVNKELITIEGLPFLNTGPLTPLSELDIYQENNQVNERIREATRNTVSKQRQQATQNNKELREEYATFYRPWRMSVREMDDKKDGERKSSTPAASTPPVTPVPPPIPEGREGREGRRYKGNSELDFQNALRASAISAQEESERRRRTEATARPDLDREAVVPNMLAEYEVKPGIFKDSNNYVEVNDALTVYGFYPPKDDFTTEEHKVFTDAFMAYPKKWGKIADELPGRTFSQCIMHYYLTKEEIKYKAKLNKRWRSQRRARKSTTRPKSNALMSDLKADGEDEETVQMTETGRPRRAAAPTFGGDAATEAEASRRGGAKDSDQGEKPASKRGRGGGTGSRGGRRGRGGAQAQQQISAPASSSNQPPAQLQQAHVPATIAPHQPLAPATSIPPGVPLIAKQEAGPRDIHSTETMIRIKEQEREATEEFIPKPPRSSRARTKDPIYVFEAAGGDHDAAGSHKPAAEMGGYGSMQPTSYWSVPEVRDFPVLLAHFGMDYDGIAGFMKTKTPVMVRNYYQRKLDSGNHEFEEIVKVAEAKKMRGEPTGPLPTPNPTPKRRYEATPSAVSHRPLAPHTDVEHPEDGRLSQKRVSSAMSPPPVQMRPAPDLAPDRNMGRYPPLAQAAAAPLGAMPDDSRAIRQSGGPPAPRPFSGPRMGFFTEGREPRGPSGTSTLAASRGQDLQPSPRVSATQGPPHPDFARLEPLPPQPLRSRVDMHAPGQYQQPLYMQQAQQGGAPGQFALTNSHSRHPSLNEAPGSPAQGMPKHTPDVSPIRRSSFGHSQPPPGHYQYGPPMHQSSTLSPVKEPTRSSATPVPQEPPRQVPAKRSNIMSILNDDAEEPPPPRKRFASEMTSSPRMSAYGMSEPGASHPRHEDKPAYYPNKAPPPQQAGRYSDYPSYPPPLGGSSASGPPTHEWIARFDPRSQSQQPAEVVRATPTPTPAPASQYGSGYQPSSNSQPPTPSQTNPPSSSHRGYQGYQGAPTPPHLTPSGRDAPPPSSSSVYRHQNPPSPPPRHSVLSYSSRQVPSPAQSPAAPMSIPPPRQSSGPGPFSPSMGHLQAAPPPSHPLGSQHRHSHSGHQSYQQQVQAMVSGQQQQQQHSSRPSLGLSGGPPTTTAYTATPQHGGPPPHGTSRAAPLNNPPPPQSLGIGRPFTPPAGVHPPPPAPSIGGMLYPPNSSSAGHMQHHTSYSRHPEPSGPPPPPGHHRVYSQGGSRQ